VGLTSTAAGRQILNYSKLLRKLPFIDDQVQEMSMQGVKILAILVVVYIAVIVAFESTIGYFQPSSQSTLVVTTTDAEGAAHARVIARLLSDGKLYVAANHWPRAWYHQALENPEIMVALPAEAPRAYRAVPVTGAEHERVATDNPTGFGFRLLTGFPPRYFVRLDPSE
jgi:hypothetical protein